MILLLAPRFRESCRKRAIGMERADSSYARCLDRPRLNSLATRARSDRRNAFRSRRSNVARLRKLQFSLIPAGYPALIRLNGNFSRRNCVARWIAGCRD
jgi:hypothetical protein